jgi:hypothetical protein
MAAGCEPLVLLMGRTAEMTVLSLFMQVTKYWFSHCLSWWKLGQALGVHEAEQVA